MQANLSGTVIETNQGSPSQKSEKQGSDSNTKSPIPATFPDWWKHLAPPDDSDEKNNSEYTFELAYGWKVISIY